MATDQEVVARTPPGRHAGADKEAEMSAWDEFTGQVLDASRRFVQGDAEPFKSLWPHRDDMTIFGGWGACEQSWAAVEARFDWVASRDSEGWLDRENLLEGVDQGIAYPVTSNAAVDDSITPPRCVSVI